MEYAHNLFAISIPKPHKVPFNTTYRYRFSEQSLEQAVVQKLARVITGLRSAKILVEQGFLQEAAIIQRAVDEAQEDILFLVY